MNLWFIKPDLFVSDDVELQKLLRYCLCIPCDVLSQIDETHKR